MTNCCTDSQNKTHDILIEKLQNEIAELCKTTTARLLWQDGKIAEMCKYLKDNLSNSLTELLADMKYSGELNELILNAVDLTLSVLRDNYIYDAKQDENAVANTAYVYGNVKRYGAVGDGETDDTEAFRNAALNAVALGSPFSVDEGTYKINGDIDLSHVDKINVEGDIIGNGFLIVGGNSNDGSGCQISFKTVPAIKVKGLKNSCISFVYTDLIELYANGDIPELVSTGYCQFYGGYAKKIRFYTEGKSLAWINENVFRIKRIEEIAFEGEWRCNNNRFEHCNLEKGVLNLNNSRNNYFSARCENGVTILTDDQTDTNFVEKEYYYSHYFGKPIEQHGGNTISYYKAHELQTEEQLLKIDRYHKHFPVDSILFREDGKFYAKQAYTEIFHSNLIKIDSIFALKVKAGSKAIRCQMNFYDENKNRITKEMTCFADGNMSYLNSGAWSYMIGANVSETVTVIYPMMGAAYVEYSVIFGDESAKSLPMDSIKVSAIKLVNTDLDISDTLKHDVYKQVPTAGYWEQGQILYANAPVAGACIGIICVSSGSPGVWKNFAPVAE